MKQMLVINVEIFFLNVFRLKELRNGITYLWMKDRKRVLGSEEIERECVKERERERD